MTVGGFYEFFFSLSLSLLKFTDDELVQLNQRKPSPSAPALPKSDGSKINADKGILKSKGKGNKFNPAESQKKALDNLDQMVKNIYDTDIPGMCGMTAFMPPPPPNSKSEGNIGYLQGACK
jgi:hypothetical protein